MGNIPEISIAEIFDGNKNLSLGDISIQISDLRLDFKENLENLKLAHIGLKWFKMPKKSFPQRLNVH